jgi:hypothetical protein
VLLCIDMAVKNEPAAGFAPPGGTVPAIDF